MNQVSLTRTLTLMLILCLAVLAFALPVSAQDETALPIWQAANEIQNQLFEAQQTLLSASSQAQQAIDEIRAAQAIYAANVQPTLASIAPDAETSVSSAFADSLAAAASGDAAAYAFSSSLIWTNLLDASYAAVLNALTAGDQAAASDWLRVREYRQATKYTLVDDPAAQAVARLQAGGGNLDDVIVTVSNDLRATYTFRLRDALSKLGDAVDQDFTTRSASWAGRISGYASILHDDFVAKRGEEESAALTGALSDLETAARQGDLAALGALDEQIGTLLANYQPVELTAEEIDQRAQLLYLFIDLVQVEYTRGVHNGQITIPIEIQEATSFRNQAAALFEELRPSMGASDAEATDQLDAHLDSLKSAIADVDTPEHVQTLSAQALDLAKQALKIEADLTDVTASFTIIDSMLKDLRTAALAGDYAAAERKRLEAYAILDAGIEQRLRGFAPEVAAEVESMFWQGLSDDRPGLAVLLANQASAGEVEAGLDHLNQAMADGQAALNVASSAPEAIVGNAAVIVFREGLEAVLILASLLAGMRTAESLRYRRSLVLGAGLALVGAVITWLVFSSILAALISLGERLEAVVSLVAIAVLLLITNWFFHKTYWVGWMANFHTQKSKILGGAAIVGPSVGLIILGFTSVYREVFETVLFLQSLVLDAGAAVVMEGVVIGLAATAVVGFLTFRLQVRLPYKRMLVFTGILIGAVLVTMVGNTVHVWQVVGWLPITPISGVYLPYWLGRWFGIFATWQGILLQIASAVFVIGSYFWAERLSQSKRKAHAQPPQRDVALNGAVAKSES
ncbi:MAG: FTR1 family protein [Anaerolineae bacterium]|nr:FTR1 family protein [Anaerolineae bacterium]